MAFLDDKRFILSHIRHSFITCDDSGSSETVMINEDANRYRTSALYSHASLLLNSSDSDSLNDYQMDNIVMQENGAVMLIASSDNNYLQDEIRDKRLFEARDREMHRDWIAAEQLRKAHQQTNDKNIRLDLESDSEEDNNDEIKLLKQTEMDYKSELLDENPPPSMEVSSAVYEMGGSRRRSNTAQKLEKLKKERKFHSKAKSIPWKCYLKDVIPADGGPPKKIVLNPELIPQEDLPLLEFDPVLNVYYETLQYRQKLFPVNDEEIRDPDIAKRSKFETIPEQKESVDGADHIDSPVSSATSPKTPATSPSENKPKVRRKSLLSMAIQKSPKAPQNPFNEYSRFDGRVVEGNAPTKRIRIFFHIFKLEEAKTIDLSKNNAPMGMVTTGKNWIEIVVLASAKINDLIGLVCWQYTNLNILPALKSDLGYYALKIAEENGDVDTDFPSLNPQDDIKRYGFPFLALVEVQTNIVITINIEPDNVFSQIISNTHQMTIGEVVEQIKKKRPQHFRQDPTVFVELRNPSSSQSSNTLNPNSSMGVYSASTGSSGNGNQHQTLDMNAKLGDFVKGNRCKLALVLRICSRASSISKSPLLDTDFKNDHFQMSGSSKLRSNRSFSFLGDHSQSPQNSPLPRKPTKDWSQNMLDLMEAPVYQTFDLNVRHNFNWTPIEMGISSSKVELNPKQTSSSRLQFLTRFNQHFKPLTIDIKDVMKTHFSTRHKATVKSNFKLYYWNGHDYKSLKFVGDANVVDDILCKLDNLIRMFVSPRRNEYLALKTPKYRTFTPRRMFRTRASSSSSSSTTSDSSTSTDSQEDDDSNNKDKKTKARVFRLRGSG